MIAYLTAYLGLFVYIALGTLIGTALSFRAKKTRRDWVYWTDFFWGAFLGGLLGLWIWGAMSAGGTSYPLTAGILVVAVPALAVGFIAARFRTRW